MSSRDNAHGHLHESPEGMETGEVPNQGMHYLSIHRVFMVAVKACGFRVGHLLQQGDARESEEKLLQAVLGQLP